MSLRPLPAFFRRLPGGGAIATNQAGAFHFFDGHAALESWLIGDYRSLADAELETLLSKGLLVEQGDEQLMATLLASRLAQSIQRAMMPPSLFMVVPTLRCDHDCRYCQASRVAASKPGFDLPLSSIERIVDIIDHVADGSIKIEFQGGEPLLAPQYIRAFVEYAEEKLSVRTPSFVICSALGPLDEAFLCWAKHHEVEFSVSLDGPEPLHEANRPSRSHRSHKRTISGIRRIRSAMGTDRVAALATITRATLAQPAALVDEYFLHDFTSIFIRPLSPLGFASRPNSRLTYSADEYLQFYKSALERVVGLNGKRLFVEETALIHLRRIFRLGEAIYCDLKSPAGYLLGALVFNYDGKIFGSDEARLLWQTTGAPELVLGTIEDSVDTLVRNPAAAKILQQSFIHCAPGCDECAYQPYCGADPLYHLATQGEPVGHKAHSFFCRVQTGLFDLLFERYHQNSQYREVFDQWLAL
ncbi:MAG: His-Xaa-Ser system radical SAM maturase HxsB [Gammaproteobacteria bacterium]|nr:His-Xaa-Ser system radical SAM maturase HxsB [Gammaproteobacteria bacterium]